MSKFEEETASKEAAVKKIADVIKPGITQEETQKCYEQWPAQYDKDMAKVIYRSPEVVAEALAEYLGDNKDAKIVDVCAGTGRTSMGLHKLGFTNLTALDGSANMLEEAKKKNIYKDFVQSHIGANRLPIPDDTFDGLCLSGAFYEGHLKPDCLLELIRIMKPGAPMVIIVPEKNMITVEALRNKLEPDMKFYEDKGLWRMMLRKVIPEVLEGIGDGILYCFVPLERKRILATEEKK